MFFSAETLYKAMHNGTLNDLEHYQNQVNSATDRAYDAPITRKAVATYVRRVKEKILERRTSIPSTSYGRDIYFGKWIRPWDVVPKLKEFSAPVGDYGIGVEIEMGFTSREASQQVAEHVKNWRHIALDYEGGDYPIEATFPPVLYSKFGSKSQPMRYLQYLQDNDHLVQEHDHSDEVGTHINVSKGGVGHTAQYRPTRSAVSSLLHRLSSELKSKYFGREFPYAYIVGQGTYFEHKMFNSTTDPQALRRYVNVAVALTDLIVDTPSTATITEEIVVAALEAGYNKA